MPVRHSIDALSLRVTAATAGVLVDVSSPEMPAVASFAEVGAMSHDEGDAPRPPPSFARMRYTFILLNEHGEWCDLQSLYAVDDAEALAVSKILADGRHFEVWQASRCVGIFSSTEH